MRFSEEQRKHCPKQRINQSGLGNAVALAQPFDPQIDRLAQRFIIAERADD